MNLKAVLEGILFIVGDEGSTIEEMSKILEVSEDEVKALLMELKKDYESDGRGLRISYLGNAFKLTTKEEHKEYYERLVTDSKTTNLSNAALEVLAVIAYNEPITRMQIDELRGVQTGWLVRKLVAKGLVKECGRSEGIGHPILYKTTREFLDYFGLSTIDDLPKIEIETKEEKSVDLYESKYNDEEIIE